MVDAARHDSGYVSMVLQLSTERNWDYGRIAGISRFESNSIKIKRTSVNNLIRVAPRDPKLDGNNSPRQRFVAISLETNVIPQRQRRFRITDVGFSACIVETSDALFFIRKESEVQWRFRFEIEFLGHQGFESF